MKIDDRSFNPVERTKGNRTKKNMKNITGKVPDAAPTDSVDIGGTSESKKSKLSAGQLAELLLATKGLQKEKFSFKVRSIDQAPDGTLIVGYNDWEKKDGNYISSIDTEGRIQWESRVGENFLEDVRVGNDGSVFVRSKSELVAYTPEGFEKFRVPLEKETRDHFVTPEGNHYFRTGVGSWISGFDSQGKTINLPSVKSEELKPGNNGEIWGRYGESFTRILPDEGRVDTFTFRDPSPEKKAYPQSFTPSPDGGLIVFARHRVVNFVPGSSDDPTMMGGPFANMGWKFPAPNLGDLSPKPNYDTHYFFKLNPEGEVEWKSNDIGERPFHAVAPDGNIYVTNNKLGTRHNLVIKKITPEGKEEVFGELDEYARKFSVRPSDGHLFVQCNNIITEFATDGSIVHSLEPEPGKGTDLSLHGFDRSGRVFLTDRQDNNLFLWDMDTNTVKILTDKETDYSIKLREKQILAAHEENESPGLKHGENCVDVGGVELTKKKKKFGR